MSILKSINQLKREVNMVKLFKKAQTATEYMIILAVIIIIALIVVGVMGGIPGLGGSTRGRASSAYWQTSDVGITAFAVTAASPNVYNVKVRNNLRDTITINTFKVSTSGSGAATNDLISAVSFVLAPGETSTITNSSGGATVCSTAGDSFSINVEISYTDDETGATYTFTGSGTKLEGVCAAS